MSAPARRKRGAKPKLKLDLSVYSLKKIDELMQDAERWAKKAKRKDLEAHYASAIGNWNFTINERNVLLKKLRKLAGFCGTGQST